MKVHITTPAIALCFALLVALQWTSAIADDSAAKRDASLDTKSTAVRSGMPTFVPTNLGSPHTRLGGATRGSADGVPRTEALVPEVAGQTVYEQPVLYWYLAAKTDHRVDFKLIQVDPIEPIIEATLEGPFEPGIQKIRLADHGISLKRGGTYQWFVAVVPNPQERLYDRIVGGGIDCLEITGELQTELDATDPNDAYFVLAEAGLWYDSLDALSQRIDASPKDANLRSQRAALLEQAGIQALN